MPIDTTTPGSPGWWLARLDKKLQDRRRRYDRLERYYSGDHPLPEGDERCRELFRRFQRKARTNYMELVVESTHERLRVEGFRTGGDSSAENDRTAWRIWQANNLDADSDMVHETALWASDAYVLVGPPPDDGAVPLITAEDPRQVIAEHHPVNRRVLRAALKTWVDDVDEKRRAVLYLPGTIHYFVGPKPAAHTERPRTTWEEEDEPVANPLGQVPVVRFVTRPRLGGDGRGEFEGVIDIQDRINDTILNRLIITKMQAYRQRWVKGVQTHDEDGNELELPFIPGVDLLWAVEDTDVEFGEFAQVDLKPVLEAIRDDVKMLVTLTGLPPHYVQGDLINASADALAAAESRLVAKVASRQISYGESWEQVMRLAFAYLSEKDALGPDAQVIWADPERKSDAQLADAAVKKQQAGVPWRQLMTDLHYSPQEIERMQSDRAQDALLAASTAAAPVPPVTPADVKARADAMGVLIRSGVDQAAAAQIVGFDGLTFTGAAPGSLRLEET